MGKVQVEVLSTMLSTKEVHKCYLKLLNYHQLAIGVLVITNEHNGEYCLLFQMLTSNYIWYNILVSNFS